MKNELLDKIESKSLISSQRIYMIAAFCSVVLILIRLYFRPAGGSFQQTVYGLYVLIFFAPGVIYLYRRTLISKSTNPFIEWWTDKLVYKIDKGDITHIISRGDIRSITINFDSIDLTTNAGLLSINLADFTGYDTKIRIRSNFEKFR